jgi:predicted nucleic acid-binding protein
MIILDTNLVSEPLKPKPAAIVLEWLDRQAPETLFITTITLAELQAGVEVLPTGKRRTALQAATTDLVAAFEGRILSFDQDSARAFGRVVAGKQAAGNPIHFADGAIAAMAAMRGFMLATRNIRDYEGTGIKLIDPWHHSGGTLTA